MNIICDTTFNENVAFGQVINREIKNLFIKGYTKQVTNAQKVALLNMILSLQDKGLWDKIDHLFLPCFAGTESEITLDVKESYGATSNVIYPCVSGFFSLSSAGAQTTNTAISTSLWGNTFNFPVIPTDFHAVVKVDNVDQDAHVRFNIGNIKQAQFTNCGDIMLTNQNHLHPGHDGDPGKRVNFNKAIFSTSIKQSGDTTTTYTEYNGDLVKSNIIESGNYNKYAVGQEYPLYPFFGDPYGDTGQKCSVAGITGIKLYGCGTYLTSEEVSDYSAIIETFLSSIS